MKRMEGPPWSSFYEGKDCYFVSDLWELTVIRFRAGEWFVYDVPDVYR
jgi:hypothetical protein